jgi:hypothetical protein
MSDYTFNPNLRAMADSERAEAVSEFLDATGGDLLEAAKILRIASALHPTAQHAEFALDLADMAEGFATHLEWDQGDEYLRAMVIMNDTELANILAAVRAVRGE